MITSGAEFEPQQLNKLRQNMRYKRRQLSAIEQQQHSLQLSQHIIHSQAYKKAQHIALYLSADGEADLSFLIQHLHSEVKKTAYLPVITSKKNSIMRFAPYAKNSPLKNNCFAIAEPVYEEQRLKNSQQLDLILAPLVAYDDQGYRIGMGGGFYDRALQHLITTKGIAQAHLKPIFMGVAHDFQGVRKLPVQQWDVALNALVTEKGIRYY